uniref:ESPR-type extended signal peptide-containing protein n=1 Tax=Dialister sp. TaxID=1955814 RepID=UPI00402A0723
MNHIYKVIWNKAKHCYTVVSEIAKSHSQSNKRVRSMTAVVAAAMMLTGFGGMAIEAANPANEDVNIAVGKGASTNTTLGNPPGLVSGYIAIGENASAWNGGNPDGIGRKESYLDFNQGAVSPSSYFTKAKVTNGTKLAGAIAIGKNTMARTGSVMIGDHTYEGELGDIEVKSSQKMTLNNGVYSTTLGASSYNSGSMSTVTGAFSITSNRGTSTLYDAQNFGATVYGSLNSIESSKSDSLTAGTANSVLGFGNRTQNTNAALVWGTGNEVTNSIEYLKINNPYWHDVSASGAQQQIIDAMRSDQYAGGSVMAIGGGNKANWATYSQLLGVRNTLTGTEKDGSKLAMINGYKNTVANAQNTTVIGSNNNATNVKSTIVMGDENTLEDRQGVISLGNENKIKADNAVAIGHDAKVSVTGGLALGIHSVSDREIGTLGYLADKETITWKANGGAVSVGSSSMTRQIINVAAGTYDTDAVNVAQLKKALESIDVDAGTGIKVDKITKGGKTTYKISTNIVGSETDTDKTTVTTNQTNTGSTDTSQETTTGTNTKIGETVTVSTETKATSFGADDNQKADVKPGGTLNINGDGNNILTSISTSTSDNSSSIKVELKKDITVDSVTAGDTSISTNGLTIKDGPSITKTGINGGDKKVTNVAAGDISEKSTDAVNGSQLFATNQQVAQNAQSISKLGNRINKVGAGAAALAALHPLDFDPDDKWDIAAGYGNYNGENAAAIGAYYRPNEDTMFSVGGSFGNGENMVNAGVSLKLGQGNHVSTSKVAMAKEIKDLRKELEGLKSALLDVNAGKKLDTSKLQLFPDVPKNHWAYEYVSALKGNGVLTGYPDGEFKGDRPMTRYEFATMLYKAMLEGATLSDKILKEFAPELERFTVDTVHQDKDGKPTVERVRTVKAEK